MRPSATSSVLLFALVLRSAVALVGLPDLGDDPDSYARLAINWSESGVFGFESETREVVSPTAYRPPLYPWLLSWLVDHAALNPQRIAVLHVMLGMVTVWLTISISRALHQSHSWLPGLAVVVDPLLLRASQLVMTETLAACLVVLAWRLWLVVWPVTDKQAAGSGLPKVTTKARSATQWTSMVGLGIVWGLAILARPTAAPWVAVCAFGGLLLGYRWKRRLHDFLFLSVLVVCTIAPWTVRNYRTFGKPIWATTHGGYTLLLANNPLLFEHFATVGPSRDWNAEPFHAAWAGRGGQESPLAPTDSEFWRAPHSSEAAASQLDELSDDRLAYSAAWATIASQPAMFALSCIYRVLWLWAPWPNTDSLLVRIAIGAWYAVWFGLAILGAKLGVRRLGWRASLLPLGLVLALTVVHAVYWSNMRMRGPVMPAVYVAAAEVVGRLSRRKAATADPADSGSLP
jgi:hypothetical protein